MAAFANKNVPNTAEKRAFAAVLVELRERWASKADTTQNI